MASPALALEPQPFAITQKWTRFVAVGCVHSTHACPVALDNVMAFVNDYQPDERIDLGDVHDWAAFRSGAKGTNDESADLAVDFDAGAEWLKRFRPTKRCEGNHDYRIHRFLDDRNAVVRYCAGKVVEAIRAVDAENGTLVKPYHQRKGWWQLGDTGFGHGWMFNEMAIRDHAETYGKCVIAHLHVPGMMIGRTKEAPPCWCVGTLADPDKMEYAQMRRNTLRWGHGLVEGEYSDKQCIVRLRTARCNHGEPEVWS